MNMATKNPATRKRQRKRQKEKAREARGRELRRSSDGSVRAPGASEYFYRSCKSKNRYTSEGRAIHACIVGSTERGALLTWYKCRFCEGWHITSRG